MATRETDYDAIMLGMGPGGEVAAGRLLAAGKRVAVVERGLIGGECGYWACIPSKTLLRATEARHAAAQAPGLARPELSWPALRDYRDTMIRHLDDTAQVAGYEKQGATVIKASGRLAGPGRVEADGQLLRAEHVILATGSHSVRPPIDGLDDVPVWTNREATTLTDIPPRAVVIGGSAAGIELGQFLARMQSQVTLVQRGPWLLDREDPHLGRLVADQLRGDGIDIRLGCQARAAHRDGADTIVELDDGTRVRTDVIVLAAGRRPTTDDLGLDTVGVTVDERGAIPVDEHCQAADRLWAVGDITGTALFTHVALYQGRIVADTLTGRARRADYTAIPRVVFADPEIAAVGLTPEQARGQGVTIATAEVELPAVLARPWTYDTAPTGHLGVLADTDKRVLIGAWALAPQAGEWIHTAALAIRAHIPLDVLLDGVAQFPTYNEAYLHAFEQLDLR